MTVWLEIGGKKRRVEVPPGAVDGALECVVDGKPVAVDVRVLRAGVMSLVVEGRQYRCVLDGDGVLVGEQRFGFEVEDPRSLRGRRGVGAGSAGPRG